MQSAGDNICALYDKIASWFAHERSRTLNEKDYINAAIKHCGNGKTVLDIGCGTGEPIALYLTEQNLAVTGIDGSAAMLAFARTKMPTQRWLHMDIRDFDLNEQFDMIIMWHSLFHLTKDAQRQVFPHITKHLRSGGVLLMTTGDCEEETFGDMQRHSFFHASLSTDEYRDLLCKNGLSVVSHTIKDPDCGDATVWMAQKGE